MGDAVNFANYYTNSRLQKGYIMGAFKKAVALSLAGLLTACGSTSKPTTLAEISNYSGSFAEHRSYALNLMEAAELGGAKDVKLKDGDSVIDLAGSNASFGFVDSLASGGSILTAGLSGLAGGLLTPDTDAQFNQAIALVDISDLPSGADADAFARKEFLNKLGVFLTSVIDTNESNFQSNTWANRNDDHWSTTDENGKYGKVFTDKSTHDVCKKLLNEKLDEAVSYNQEFDKQRNLEWQKECFGEACGIRTSPILVEGVVTSEKLPWLDKGRKYIVVTSKFGSTISQNRLSKAHIPVEGLYLYYTTNGANVGKLKDTGYPYIQAPHGKEMYFIKP